MNVDVEFYIEEQAEIIARKATDGFQQATQRSDGHWAGKTFEPEELVAVVAELANYPTALREEIARAACDIIDDWGGPWVTIDEPNPLENDLFADDHL
jgi:hypothetical protein